MNCPICKDAKLGITQVYAAGADAEARNLVCHCCGFRSTSLTFMLARPQERRRGWGAKAIADKVKRGEIKPPE